MKATRRSMELVDEEVWRVSLFDQVVNEALRSRAELTSLRPVVEKELLHHDILREMSEAGLLTGLTFESCLQALLRQFSLIVLPSAPC